MPTSLRQDFPTVGQVVRFWSCCSAMARKCYKRPSISKRNNSKSNYAKNGNPWISYRNWTNNRNNRSIGVYHSLVRGLTDLIGPKSDLVSSISELESLGLRTENLNEFNDCYEIGNLVENLKQRLFQDHKSMLVFTD